MVSFLRGRWLRKRITLRGRVHDPLSDFQAFCSVVH